MVLPGRSQVPAQSNGSGMNSRYDGIELSALTRERLVEVGSALASADIAESRLSQLPDGRVC